MSEPSQPAESQRRVVKIEVTKLFNQFNHVIELKPERVTVLHGPNGVGKTKLLEMVSWLFRSAVLDSGELKQVPFERLEITFSDGERLLALGKHPDSGLERMVHVSSQGVNGRISRPLSLLRCLHIPTQRLRYHEWREKEDWDFLDRETDFARLTVSAVAEQLVKRVTATRQSYFAAAVRLDESFPRRVLAIRNEPAWDAETLKEHLSLIEKRRSRLKGLGLIENFAELPLDPGEVESLDESSRRILAAYAVDSEAKFQTLGELARRMELLLDVMNTQLRRKRICFDSYVGLVVETDRGESLMLDQLSAGEQHLLVLHADLLLNMQANTLVLIDEPELGWHVTWQKKFLGKLLQIAELVKIDVIVATHSPFILGSRLDLGVALADDEGSVDEAQD